MDDTASNLKGEIQLCSLENAGVESQNVLQILNRDIKSSLTELDDMHACTKARIGFSFTYPDVYTCHI